MVSMNCDSTKRLLQPLLVAVVLAITLTQCSQLKSVEVFNNSGEPIQLIVGWLMVSHDVPHGSVVEIEGSELYKVQVQGETRIWSYQQPAPESPEEIQQGAAHIRHSRFDFYFRAPTTLCQLEPGGKLYLLRPGANVPAAEFEPQPSGWPLEPVGL
jgi:hypothetical protein